MRVGFEQFKGATEEVDLAPRTLLVGPNGSGKSRILQALQVAILGEVPSLGKRGLAGLLSVGAESMSVSLEVGDRRIDRRFSATGSGIGGEQVRIDGGRWRGVRAAEADVADIVGRWTMAFDVGELLRATPGQRSEMLLRHLPEASAVTVDQVLTRLEESLAPADISELAALVRRMWRPTRTLPENITEVREGIKQAASDALAHAKTLDAAHAAAKREVDALPAEGQQPAALEKRRNALAEEAAQIRERVAREQAQAAASADYVRRVAAAELEIKRLHSLPPVQPPTFVEVLPAEEASRLADAITRGDAAIKDRQSGFAVLDTRARRSADALSRAQSVLDGLQRNAAQIAGDGCSECPTCHQTIDEFARDALLALIDDARSSLEAAADANHEAQMERQTAAAALEELKQEQSRLSHALTQHLAAQRAAEIARNQHQRVLAVRAEQMADAVRRLDELRQSAPAVPSADAPPAGERLAAIAAEIEDLAQQIKLADRARAARAALRRTEEQHAQARGSADLMRAAVGAFRKFASEAIANAVRPLVSVASELLSRVHPTWALEVDAEGGIELRARQGEHSVPFASLSGGEGVVYGAALAVAVVRLVQPKLRLLMLEVAEVDAVRLDALLSALEVMAGDFDSVIVATCHAQGAPVGWHVRQLGAVEVQ